VVVGVKIGPGPGRICGVAVSVTGPVSSSTTRADDETMTPEENGSTGEVWAN
jgi:hypothetical protein